VPTFRVVDADAADIGRWAEDLGVDRSEPPRRRLHALLVRLRGEDDAEK
jgi:hypothetical protein